ncbi:hypothetical protein F3Y22_tig00116962pilonHSYRG00617 [Hibiscus syriacus]|uniref:Uncharacterized protein n=1 Tax=Hibiscus syriacus TaxID=106335 RepID=A0A6A2WKX0_HIBSY|nr:hypothetical protein F3Y22_tig00116962pilonHSYRG00617 [Hibiscus syriacus]
MIQRKGAKGTSKEQNGLYEQLSIPSQRFNAAPLPPKIPTAWFLQYLQAMVKVMKLVCLCHLDTPMNLQFRPRIWIPSHQLQLFLKKLHFNLAISLALRKFLEEASDDDDLRVPTPAMSRINRNSSCSNQGENQEHFPKSNLSSSMQPQNANGISVDSKSRRYVGNQAEENGRLFQSNQDIRGRSNSTRDNILGDASSDLQGFKITETPLDSCNKENKSSSVDVLNSEVRANARLNHEYISVESVKSLENASKVRNKSCLRQSLGIDNGSPKTLENISKAVEENNTGATLVDGQKISGKYEELLSRIECADEKAVTWLPLPSLGLSPPESQWLVPVMSPSEGLVYKPYAGPCPPTAGFLAPVYGGCGPLNQTAVGADFLNTTYGVPASHQHGIGILPGNRPRCQTYFPHYGMPVTNSTVSDSTVEQISSFQSKGNQLQHVM